MFIQLLIEKKHRTLQYIRSYVRIWRCRDEWILGLLVCWGRPTFVGGTKLATPKYLFGIWIILS